MLSWMKGRTGQRKRPCLTMERPASIRALILSGQYLNGEEGAGGYLVVAGKVPRAFFSKKYYGYVADDNGKELSAG